MEVKGEIKDIIYQNKYNDYLIARFEPSDETEMLKLNDPEDTIIVGYIPFINPGDTILITGQYIIHKDYGEQIKVETCTKLMPETIEALEKYLANGNVNGIGPKLAKKIVDKFGEDTINVLRSKPHDLAMLKGITKARAEEMSESFVENWEIWQIVGVLEKYNIGMQSAKKAYKMLGINAIETIEKNPYVLFDITKNIEFRKVDIMAINMGITRNNYERIKSGIKYILLKNSYTNGHSCMILDELIQEVISLLNISKEDLEDNIVNLVLENIIVIEKRNLDKWVYLYGFDQVEKEIAKRVNKLKKSKNSKKLQDIDEKIDDLKKNSNIELSEKQREAIKLINDNNVAIITGGPRNTEKLQL